MAIRIRNTMTRRLDPLSLLTPGKVRLFVCGPTVYDFAHLGHAKTYTQFDMVVRYLRFRGLDVTYLQNITDIDDKIIGRAAERGIAPGALAREYERYYHQDMQALGNTSVSHHARALDHIADIVRQVERLIEQGYAYRISDGYYFEVGRFADYGKLSHRTSHERDDALSRIDENPEKRDPRDFCLWKFSLPGEPIWSAPFGDGRPGWHIEDTAITEHFFGPQYDLHGGAHDLIFPHHEAEIAQMEAASGRVPLVQQWMHTGFLNTKRAKMSKSAGNFLTIRDVLKTVHYTTLRYFFLSTHYRSEMEFTDEGIEQARKAVERIHIFTRSIHPDLDDVESEAAVKEAREGLIDALDTDFDTPRALTILFSFIKDQNRRGLAGSRVAALFSDFNQIFFMIPSDVLALNTEIEELVAQRATFRKNRQFREADAIRDHLAAMGIVLEDGADGILWRRRY